MLGRMMLLRGDAVATIRERLKTASEAQIGAFDGYLRSLLGVQDDLLRRIVSRDPQWPEKLAAYLAMFFKTEKRREEKREKAESDAYSADDFA